jgi:hypothetical protein
MPSSRFIKLFSIQKADNRIDFFSCGMRQSRTEIVVHEAGEDDKRNHASDQPGDASHSEHRRKQTQEPFEFHWIPETSRVSPLNFLFLSPIYVKSPFGVVRSL